jgi:hypothetical protein
MIYFPNNLLLDQIELKKIFYSLTNCNFTVKLITTIFIKSYKKSIIICNFYIKKIIIEILKFKNYLVSVLGISPP